MRIDGAITDQLIKELRNGFNYKIIDMNVVPTRSFKLGDLSHVSNNVSAGPFRYNMHFALYYSHYNDHYIIGNIHNIISYYH